MKKDSLINFLDGYLQNDIYRFHMPGHKNNKNFFHKNLLGMDITEIPLADNLHNANGVILNLQKAMAALFGAEESFLTVNGSSSAIIAAICAVCPDGGQILAARNAHRSFFSGLIFSGATPVYMMPQITRYGFSGSVAPSDIKAALEENPAVKAVFVTSPTYEGIVSDIAEIARITHEAGKILIVDEAHGSHFNFSGSFPKSAVNCGADIVINSLHKTLPVLTQTSVLHVCGKLANRDKIKQYLSMLQTTSPSYVIMGQADFCMGLLEEKGHDIFRDYIKMLTDFRKKAECFKNIQLIGENLIGEVFDVDISKLIFYINSEEISGGEIEKLLAERYRVQIEASFENYIIAMTSCADTQAGYSMLYEGLKKIDSGIINKTTNQNLGYVFGQTMPIVAMPPRAAVTAASKRIRLKDSENEISAEFITAFPPGIPTVAPGERITESIIEKNKNIKYISIVSGGKNDG